MALDIRALARAMYDPRQFPGAYSDEKRRLRGLQSDQYAAQFADPRSIQAQNDPNDPRSIAAQDYPGLFTPPQMVQPQPQPPQPTGVDDLMRFSTTESYNGIGRPRTKKRFSFSSEI